MSFGKKPRTVEQEYAFASGAMKAAWADAMSWAGPKAVVTDEIRRTVADIAAR